MPMGQFQTVALTRPPGLSPPTRCGQGKGMKEGSGDTQGPGGRWSHPHLGLDAGRGPPGMEPGESRSHSASWRAVPPPALPSPGCQPAHKVAQVTATQVSLVGTGQGRTGQKINWGPEKGGFATNWSSPGKKTTKRPDLK